MTKAECGISVGDPVHSRNIDYRHRCEAVKLGHAEEGQFVWSINLPCCTYLRGETGEKVVCDHMIEESRRVAENNYEYQHMVDGQTLLARIKDHLGTFRTDRENLRSD